jgi:hypothetical protein
MSRCEPVRKNADVSTLGAIAWRATSPSDKSCSPKSMGIGSPGSYSSVLTRKASKTTPDPRSAVGPELELPQLESPLYNHHVDRLEIAQIILDISLNSQYGFVIYCR